jgi:predicted nuclease with TOPRIM domain
MTIKTLTYAALAERLKCTLEAARSLVTGEVATLKERIESLQAELANLEATAARHWADYERERDRADRLVTELLKATANTTRELAAKL